MTLAEFEARADRAHRLAYRMQAVAVVLWWVGMKGVPGVYELFAYPGLSREQLFWFGLPDLVVLGGGALWAGRREGSRIAGAVVLGGFLYATLWCLSASVRTGGGWFGTMLMSLAVMLNVLLLGRQSLFRVCDNEQPAWVGVKTFLQSAVIWGLCLGVFPWVILSTLGEMPELIRGRAILGGVVFLTGSALGVRSAMEMVRVGKGTPLPMDAAVNLVTRGPYQWVRNPMAVAGLVQGLGVALFLGSVEIAVYVLLGGLVWNFFVRPEEELFLFRRFGEPYAEYVKEIRCWIPRS